MSRIVRIKRHKETTSVGTLLAFTVFVSNISQMPVFVEMHITRYISIGVWLVFFLSWLIGGAKKRVYINSFPIKAALVIYAYAYLMRLFVPAFAKSDLYGPILLSAFVFFNGINIGPALKEKELERVFTAYIMSALFVCTNIYYIYLRGQSLASRFYLYDSKNSVSQIIWTGMILIMIRKFKEEVSTLKRFLYLFAFLFMLYSLVAIKSRATLISIPIVVLIVFLNRGSKRSVKIMISIAAIAVLFVLSNEDTYTAFVDNVVFAGRNATDINDLSSERYNEWIVFGQVFFKRNYIFGNGRYKMESVILTSLLEYGIIIGPLILTLAIYPIRYAWKRIPKTNPYRIVLISVAISYVVNGIFEQLAPFGPGVKCYFLWLLLGILHTESFELLERHNDERAVGK